MKPGYKQTEVGVIPEEWDVKSLREFGELTSSKRIFESDYVSVGVPFFRGKEISDLVDGEAIDDPYFISTARFNLIKSKFGAPGRGDILITAVGTLGNVYVVDTDEPFYFKDGNVIWLRKIHGVEPRFLGIQLRRAKSAILDGAIGTSQKALTIVVLRDLSVAVPPAPEQHAIAEALSDVDGLLGGLDRLVAKKRDLKQAAMQQLLTGQTRLPGFHGEWEVKTLGQLLREIGDGATPSTAEPRNFGGGINWVVIDDIKDEIITTATTLTERGLQSCAATLWQPGTLVLSTGATIGEVGIARVPVATKQGICGLVVNSDEATPMFLKYWFALNKSSLLSKAQGSTIKEVRAPTLIKCELRTPKVPEQTAIAGVLSDMDAELAVLEQRRAKTRALKQGMMQELLTGRIRLV